MNKENAPPPAIAGVDLQSPPLTAEQRSRITRNFRAAKALLARKRPLASPIPPFKSVPISPSLHSIHPPLVRCNNVNQPPRRVPLAEIQPNRFSAPAAKPPIVNSPIVASASPAASATPQSILDEDLDDDFLREVDAICEMSTAKKARPTPESAPATLARDSNLPQKSMTEVLDENSSPTGVDGGRGLFHDANIVLPLVTAASPVRAELPAADSRPVDGDNSSMVDGGRSLFQDGDADLTPPKYREYFQKLNDAQREAACCDIGQPLMIVAGPGSGKTSTMVGRVLTLLKEGIGPANILAMTFTTAAASEMRDRIKAVVGKEIAKEVAISTFHSFCLKLCRSHAEKLGRTSEFLIYGHGQQRRAVIEALRLLENGRKSEVIGGHKLDEIANGAENFKEKSKKWQKFVTQAKASGKTPEEFTTMGDEIGAGVLGHYNDILKSCNALDYHDFISCSVKLLEDFPEVHKESLEMWKAIVVDEFQDTSSMQYHLLKILASHNRVTIVGDDDQSIFSFNGANVCGFDSFRRDFPTHKEIRLNKNYRSTRCIVEAATSLICNNRKRYQSKKAETDNSIGCKITVKECHNEDAQCAFVVDKILEITSDDPSSSCSFGNVAILYRRQISGKPFQSSFRDRKIPFNIHGVAFYRKKVIKAILAILRTTLPGCDDNPSRQAFKALYNGDKEEKKMVIDYIEKVSSARKCGFLSAATDIFASKISGTLRRTQLTQGRKVLSTLDMLSKLVNRVNRQVYDKHTQKVGTHGDFYD